MTTPNIEAILFDWDLTLARVLGDVTESERLAALFRTQGLEYTADQVEAARDKYRNGTGRGRSKYPDKPQTRRDIIHSYFQILAYLGYVNKDWELGNRLYSAHSFLPTQLYADTLPLLQWLQQAGFALGIISNHARTARQMIERNVGEFVPSEHITISQEVGVHKPAKTIFRHATRRMKISPSQAVFVGDNLAVDAIGAVEQGGFGRALWIDREGIGAEWEMPDRVFRITSLDQVLNFIC